MAASEEETTLSTGLRYPGMTTNTSHPLTSHAAHARRRGHASSGASSTTSSAAASPSLRSASSGSICDRDVWPGWHLPCVKRHHAQSARGARSPYSFGRPRTLQDDEQQAPVPLQLTDYVVYSPPQSPLCPLSQSRLRREPEQRGRKAGRKF